MAKQTTFNPQRWIEYILDTYHPIGRLIPQPRLGTGTQVIETTGLPDGFIPPSASLYPPQANGELDE